MGKAFSCINKNDDVRMHSSSGGVFTLLAEYVFGNDGVVFGAAFDDELNVKHIEIKNKDELWRLRGSKYLQSKIGDSFIIAKERLEQGRLVLFTGTPCQISGLKSYLNRDYINLITQDFICHGVPSPMVWQKYLQYQSFMHHNQIDKKSQPVFRQKDSGWKNYSVSLKFSDATEYNNTFDKDLYMKAFLGNISLRLSCYNCHSKSLERESDITLADFWGVENILPTMFDNKGTSLVLINSEKGDNIFKAVSKNMYFEEIDIDEATKYNISAFNSCKKPRKREWFIKNVSDNNFDKCVYKCIRNSGIRFAKNKIKIILQRMCK